MMEELDQEQIKILRNAFDAFDSDKEGVIQTDNFGTILEMLGHRLDPKTLKQMIASVDTEDSGLLDFEEFCQLASKFVDVEEDVEAIAQELREAFRMYDKEGKGYLTTDVLRDILHELDDKLSSDDLDMMIDEIDADGSGTVDFEEFMEVMTG